MSKWEPEVFDADPTVNALLNIAAAIETGLSELTQAVSENDPHGVDVAEAIGELREDVKAAIDGIENTLDGVKETLERNTPA